MTRSPQAQLPTPTSLCEFDIRSKAQATAEAHGVDEENHLGTGRSSSFYCLFFCTVGVFFGPKDAYLIISISSLFFVNISKQKMWKEMRTPKWCSSRSLDSPNGVPLK